jgi:hypothetical protein
MREKFVMSRGRKKSPRESVDSILLAISHNEDIDEETMSRYLDRLDEEWANGAREKVLDLLRSNDAMVQSAAVRILGELATDFDLEGLEDFVADPTVSDMSKLSLSPILKELGSEMADDGIIEYLNDPSGAIRQMQLRLLEIVGQSEMGVETVLDDVVSMPVDRRLGFIHWLLIPLLVHQTGKIVMEVIDALEQMGPIAVNHTIPALNHLIATTSNRELKQHARAVLGRLTMQSMLGVEDAVLMEDRRYQLPVHEARVSSIDGSGTQLIMLSWVRPDGLIKGINVLSQSQRGIKDCYGVDEMDTEHWQSLVGDLNEQGFSSFMVPFEYARALVLEARAYNKRSRSKLPIAYAIWRPLIEGLLPAKKLTSPYPTILEPIALDPAMQALAQQGNKLYELNEFLSWMYEPIERIEPFITRHLAEHDVFNAYFGHKNKSEERKHQKQLMKLVDEAVGSLIDEKWRILYEERLRRQAALFQVAGREEEVALIRAVAAQLHPASGVSIQEQAFPRALISFSIEQGPLRLMVESLRSGEMGTFPPEFFR